MTVAVDIVVLTIADARLQVALVERASPRTRENRPCQAVLLCPRNQ